MGVSLGRLLLCILQRRRRADCGAHGGVFGDQRGWHVVEGCTEVVGRLAVSLGIGIFCGPSGWTGMRR